MSDTERLYLELCSECHSKMLQFPAESVRDGFVMMPKDLCPECEGKITQAIRLVLTGAVEWVVHRKPFPKRLYDRSRR